MFYLTREYLPVFIPLGFIGMYRWFWFIVRVCVNGNVFVLERQKLMDT